MLGDIRHGWNIPAFVVEEFVAVIVRVAPPYTSFMRAASNAQSVGESCMGFRSFSTAFVA